MGFQNSGRTTTAISCSSYAGQGGITGSTASHSALKAPPARLHQRPPRAIDCACPSHAAAEPHSPPRQPLCARHHAPRWGTRSHSHWPRARSSCARHQHSRGLQGTGHLIRHHPPVAAQTIARHNAVANHPLDTICRSQLAEPSAASPQHPRSSPSDSSSDGGRHSQASDAAAIERRQSSTKPRQSWSKPRQGHTSPRRCTSLPGAGSARPFRVAVSPPPALPSQGRAAPRPPRGGRHPACAVAGAMGVRGRPLPTAGARCQARGSSRRVRREAVAGGGGAAGRRRGCCQGPVNNLSAASQRDAQANCCTGSC